MNNISNEEVLKNTSFVNFNKVLNDISFFLKTNFKILIFTALFGASMGIILSRFERPIYKATLTFAMEDEKVGGNLGGALGLASSLGLDIGGSGGGLFAAGNLSELMKSRLIIERVLLKPVIIRNNPTTLLDYYINFNNIREGWSGNSKLEKLRFLPNTDRNKFSIEQDSIIQIIYKSIIKNNSLTIVQKDKKVTIMSIEVKSKDELFAKLFCENLANETSDFYISTRNFKSTKNVLLLQGQVDSVRRELNNAITGVAAEIDNVYNLNPALNIKNSSSKKRQIDVQTNTSILTNLIIQLQLAKVNQKKETPLIQVIDSPIFPLEVSKIGTIYFILIGVFISLTSAVILILIKEIIKGKIVF